MKMALLLATSSFLSALDPGCGAGVGSNVANGGGAGGEQTDAGASGGGLDAGALPQVDCGPLGRHFFCDDFSGALPARFGVENVSAGVLGVDTTHFVSGPQSLLATTQHPVSGPRTYARLHKDFAVTGTRFVLAFSTNVPSSCIGPSDLVQTSSIVANGMKYSLTVAQGPSHDAVEETSLVGGLWVQEHQLTSRIPTDRWTRVTLDVDLTRKTMDLSVDGTKIMAGEPLRYAPDAQQTPSIESGVLVDNLLTPPTACAMQTDDVTFDLAP